MNAHQHDMTIPPSPRDPGEAMRWEEGRRRRRLLDGCWRVDLEQRLQRRIGSTRRQAWGEPSCKILPFATIARELAVLYTSPPAVRHDRVDVTPLAESMRLSGLWGLMSRVQYYTLGLREMLIRTTVSEEGRPSYRPVYPDMVIATGRRDAPDLLESVRELRLREHPETKKPVWTLDIMDVSDPDAPVYRVVECKSGLEEGADWTASYLGSDMSGDAYPYRRADGRPVLAYVLHHADRTGDRLWDPYRWMEMVEASLDLAVAANMLDHTFMQASWPQRWIVGAQPAGLETVSEDGKVGRREVVVDPSTVLLLEPMAEYAGQVQVGQWESGADVEKMATVIAEESARIAQDAGVSASDLQRLNSQRSGVSISLTNEGKRSVQRRLAGQFRDPDERLVALTAILTNRATGSAWPEGGYTVQYQELSLSPDELSARREHVLELMDRRLLSPIDAYRQLNPGVTVEQARQALAEIARTTTPAPGSTPATNRQEGTTDG